MVQPHGKEGRFSPGGPDPAWGGGEAEGARGAADHHDAGRPRAPAARPPRTRADIPAPRRAPAAAAWLPRLLLASGGGSSEGPRGPGGRAGGGFSRARGKFLGSGGRRLGSGEANLERGGRSAAALGLCKRQTRRLLAHQAGGSIQGSPRAKGGAPESGHTAAPPPSPPSPVRLPPTIPGRVTPPSPGLEMCAPNARRGSLQPAPPALS